MVDLDPDKWVGNFMMPVPDSPTLRPGLTYQLHSKLTILIHLSIPRELFIDRHFN
jgi:hypothetical protein